MPIVETGNLAGTWVKPVRLPAFPAAYGTYPDGTYKDLRPVTDIFQEVEEDVRRERYEQLWKQYGNYVMAAAALLVLGVAGYEAWRNYDLKQRETYSDRYEAAEKLIASNNIAGAERFHRPRQRLLLPAMRRSRNSTLRASISRTENAMRRSLDYAS